MPLLFNVLIISSHLRMRYNITIQEILAKTMQVEASSQEEAELTVKQWYRNSDVVLSEADYVSTDIISESCPYYKSPNNDFTLIQDDCVDTFGFDMIFADPPYFLSGGGIR